MTSPSRTITPQRCMEPCGGTIGCTTFCTRDHDHDGPCSWDAHEQLAWNEREEARRHARSVDVLVRMDAVDGAEWFAANQMRLPADVRHQVRDQIWLRAVFTEQRRRTNTSERAAFDERADRILAALDPQETR